MKNLSKLLLVVSALILSNIVAAKVDTGLLNVKAAECVKLNKKSATLYKGTKVKLSINGVKKGTKVKWRTSNKKVVSIKSNGSTCTIIGKKAGSASVTAKVGSKTYSCKVTVRKDASLSNTSYTLKKENSFVLNLKGSYGKTSKWSTNNSVVKLEKISKTKYRVVGVKEGNSVITVSVRGKKLKCSVTVMGDGVLNSPIFVPEETESSIFEESEIQMTEKIEETEVETEKETETEIIENVEETEVSEEVQDIFLDYEENFELLKGRYANIFLKTDVDVNSISVDIKNVNTGNYKTVVELLEVEKIKTFAGERLCVTVAARRKGLAEITVSTKISSVTVTANVLETDEEWVNYDKWLSEMLNTPNGENIDLSLEFDPYVAYTKGVKGENDLETLKNLGAWLVDNRPYISDNVHGNYGLYREDWGTDCNGYTGVFLDAAKKLGLKGGVIESSVSKGHIFASVEIQGETWSFDAGTNGYAGERSFSGGLLGSNGVGYFYRKGVWEYFG